MTAPIAVSQFSRDEPSAAGKPRVLIVGAGIGGLTVGIALGKLGVKATIVERASALASVGAGIGLQPNATAVLSALGVDFGNEADGAMGRFDIVDGREKIILSTTPSDVETGSRPLNIRRADLHSRLLARLHDTQGDTAILFDHGLRAIEKRADGALDVSFDNGSQSCWDIVVGADGLHSRVRRFLHSAEDCTPRDSGQLCWRFIVEAPDLAPAHSVERWSKGLRVGLIPLSRGGIYVYLVASYLQALSKPPADLNEELQLLFGQDDPTIDQLLARAAHTNATIHRGPLMDLPPLNLGQGQVVLLGDAAHAMTPNMGQGAGMAIEDAAALALLWNQTDASQLGEALSKARNKRVKALHQRAWQMGEMAHYQNGLAQFARNTLLRATPRRLMDKSMRDSWMPGLQLATQLEELFSN